MMFKVRHDLCPPTVKNLFSLKALLTTLEAQIFTFLDLILLPMINTP